MVELVRQVVAFGDFKTIGFEALNKFNEFIEKYSLSVEAAQDISFKEDIPPAGVQIRFDQPLPFIRQARPILINKSNTINIFLGTTRMHVEQRNADTETYLQFLDFAKEFFCLVSSSIADVSINRIAVNGKLLIEDLSKMDDLYSLTFKESNLYGKRSDEFSFRINTVIDSTALNAKINKIISVARITENQPDSQPKPLMFIDYDYNTIDNKEYRFDFSQMSMLITEGIDFKTKVINFEV